MVAAMLALCAIHDMFKITALKPREEADHDLALKRCLTYEDERSWLTPSYAGLPERLKKVLVATTEGYNHGWLVQAETSVAVALPDLEIFKDSTLMAFYALHWISDVGGANPTNPGGSSAWLLWGRFGTKTFLPMVEAFNVLAQQTHDGGFHKLDRPRAYLEWIKHCWRVYLPGVDLPTGPTALARHRLVAMLQQHAEVSERVWKKVPGLVTDDTDKDMIDIFTAEDRQVLAAELALTGIEGQTFSKGYASEYGSAGPAFSLKFIPQYVREHAEEGVEELAHALHNVAEALRLLRAARPLSNSEAGVNIDAILRCVGKRNGQYRPAATEKFSFWKINDLQYEILHVHECNIKANGTLVLMPTVEGVGDASSNHTTNTIAIPLSMK